MTSTLTLAHFSDLHLTNLEGFHPFEWNIKRGLGYLNWRHKRRHVHQRDVADALVADAKAQGAGHFAVTGDLAHLGLPGEYMAARRWLEGLGAPEHVSVVPGNHDIYTYRMGGRSCLACWGPFVSSCAEGKSLASHPDVFPYVRKLGCLALIGVNSALPRAPFIAAGRCGAGQLAQLSRVLDRVREAGLIRVILIHHPPLPGQAPRRRALDDAGEFEAVIERRGAELVLHGHNHRDMLAWRRWSGGDIPVVGVASGSAVRPHKMEPQARYRIFRFEPRGSGAQIQMVTRGLAESGRAIIELDRRVLSRVPGE